jgi:hypothetical protein
MKLVDGSGKFRLAVLVGLWLISFGAVPVAQAATFDEIVSMGNAGLSPEVIIEVIKATGLDKPIDVDTWISLQEQGVDESVLEYLATLLPAASEKEDASGYPPEYERQSNWIGGEGFHHDQHPDYPPQTAGNSNEYWGGPHYRDNYYPPPGSIGVYAPPVYIPNYYPFYYSYPAPNPYYYNRGYWENGWYVTYDHDFYIPYNTYQNPYWPNGYWDNNYWTGNPGGWFRRWRHDHHGDNWGGSISYESDDFGISLHF